MQQKPDGKRLDVRRDNFQLTVSGGKGSSAPAFSDETTLTIVFPDVAVLASSLCFWFPV